MFIGVLLIYNIKKVVWVVGGWEGEERDFMLFFKIKFNVNMVKC